MHSDALVYSCFLERGHIADHALREGRGAYVYVLEGDSVEISNDIIPVLGAAQVMGATDIRMSTKGEAELLLVDVSY